MDDVASKFADMAERAFAQVAQREIVIEQRDDEIALLRAAIIHVRAIIVDGATTGFNCHDGDWAERLFASQGVTHAALTKGDQSGDHG